MNKITLKFVSESFEVSKMQITKLEINNDLKDYWVTFKPNSVASLRKGFLKITFKDESSSKEKVRYLILNNPFLIYLDNQIELRYKGKLQFYIHQSFDKASLKTMIKQLKEKKNQLNLIKAYQENNIHFYDSFEASKLNDEIFYQSAVLNFELIKEEK
ncbi:MSC_0621 family F1-like ATPase epsilon subunit [Mycoplasmopsis gallinacea]|uniref:Uncharacterized protein n=1 Tax=Mycoplasmopsis gallinacea TaxID=29556 RepID=A0A6H0V5F3_9BACT|nr:hypothetical protein [Mycoplasmopsis gallinacea]QIW62257.1 hypothetical protein GOQ20_02290 [Mycoplasmopsis gallinacea]